MPTTLKKKTQPKPSTKRLPKIKRRVDTEDIFGRIALDLSWTSEPFQRAFGLAMRLLGCQVDRSPHARANRDQSAENSGVAFGHKDWWPEPYEVFEKALNNNVDAIRKVAHHCTEKALEELQRNPEGGGGDDLAVFIRNSLIAHEGNGFNVARILSKP